MELQWIMQIAYGNTEQLNMSIWFITSITLLRCFSTKYDQIIVVCGCVEYESGPLMRTIANGHQELLLLNVV